MKRLTESEAKRLYVALKNSLDPKDIILQILFETGARIGEVTSLGAKSLEYDRLKIKALKNSHNRSPKISDNLRVKLSRMTEKPTYVAYVTSSENRDTQRRLMTRHFHQVSERLLGRRYNIHALRHTAISRLYEASRDIVATQAWAGHKSGNSTLAYIALERQGLAEKTMSEILGG
jgi:integrase